MRSSSKWSFRRQDIYPLDIHTMEGVVGKSVMMTVKEVRRLPREYLNFALEYEGRATPFNRGLMSEEMKRRAAWDAPAAWSVRLALSSLFVSLVALAVSILK